MNRTLLIICIVLMLFGVFLPVSYAAPGANKPVPTTQASQRSGQSRAPTDIRKVAIGSSFMLGVLQNQTLVSWGDNRQWQSTIPNRYKSTLFNDVATSVNTAYALDATGMVVSWGDEGPYSENIVPVDAQSNVTAIAAGGRFCVALKSNGTVIVWGRNDFGQRDIPAGLTNVTAIAAGARHALALKSDGTVIAWGDYKSGQTIVPRGLTGVIAIAAGEDH